MHFKYKDLDNKNLSTLTIKNFIQAYHPGLSRETIRVAIAKDKIDHHRPGNEYFVVLTEKTRSYIPQKHKNRIL